MQPQEAFVIALGMLIPGGAWLGYVFIVNDAKWKMAQIKAGQSGSASEEDMTAIRQQLDQLRRDMTALRDRSSEFDLSLETRLHQLELQVRKEAPAPAEQLHARLDHGDL